jgi:hypothetical protein
MTHHAPAMAAARAALALQASMIQYPGQGALGVKNLVLLTAAAIPAGCGSGRASTQDATVKIRPFIENLNAAWQTLDTAKAAPFYAKDAGLAFYDVAPLKYTGWQE